jgi:hypothetical protein
MHEREISLTIITSNMDISVNNIRLIICEAGMDENILDNYDPDRNVRVIIIMLIVSEGGMDERYPQQL